MASPSRIWTFRLLTGLAGLGLVAGVEGVLRLVPWLGPAPLVVERAEQGGKRLLAVNRLYSQRFFFGQQGRLAAAGQMAERFFFEPAPDNLYRVVFVGASTVQGFPHPRRLAAASFLEAMLQDALPERTVEVFNLGITSIASFAVARVVEDALALEPDLVVVYTGHNEFYGIYGADDQPTPYYKQIGYLLRQLHLTRSVQAALDLLGDGDKTDTDLLKLMAERGEVPPDSPRRRAAERDLNDNLSQIVSTCREARVSLVLCTLAANDAGFAPAGSAVLDLAALQARQWEQWVQGAAVRLTRDYVSPDMAAGALNELEQAGALSDRSAWLWYLRGLALERMGRAEEAYPAFRRARDFDTMPWRAPTVHSEIVRSLAQEEGVVVADVEAVLRAAAPPQGVDWHWMVDHVHFSVPGQILLAREILKGIAQLEDGPRPDLDLVRDGGDYRLHLGDLPAERAMLYRKMGDMLGQVPMDRYNGHNARYLLQLAAMEWQRLRPAAQRGIQAWDGRAPLVLAVADRLFAEGDFRGAQQYYHAARLEAPFTRRGDLWSTVQWAWSIKMQEHAYTPEQRKVLRKTLDRADYLAYDPAIKPAFIDFAKGQLHHLLGDHDPALVHLERAFLNVDFRRKYAISLFRPLAAELVRAGRQGEGQRYATMVGEETGRPLVFRRLLDAAETGITD